MTTPVSKTSHSSKNATVAPPSKPENAEQATPGTAKIAGVGRRLGSLLYDVFLVLALWFVATALALLALGLLGADVEQGDPLVGSWIFQVYLIAVAFTYYAWSLCVSGQTLGMRAWRIKAVSHDLGAVNLRTCAIRFVTSMAGLTHLSCWFHPSRESIHDQLSRSKLVMLKS